MVGEAPVVLLGHRPVPTPKSGFDVRDRNVQLGCSECRRERRIHVSANDE